MDLWDEPARKVEIQGEIESQLQRKLVKEAEIEEKNLEQERYEQTTTNEVVGLA